MNTKKLLTDSITVLSQKWGLSNFRSLGDPKNLNNYVSLVYSSIYTTDVVLKILLTNTHEAEALALFNGNGCVRLLDYDVETKGLLLEYISPGITLKSLFPINDAQAAQITAEVIKKLHAKNLIPKEHSFKTVNQWLDLLNKFQSKKIPERLLEKARQLSEKLLSLKQEQYVLHGDLHHENILRSSDETARAIDPKGVIGPLEYEVGRFIMNPIPDLLQQHDAQKIIKNRIDIFSEIFGFEKQRLLDWAFVQAVLSACWTEQGGSEELFNYFVKFAEIMANSLVLDHPTLNYTE